MRFIFEENTNESQSGEYKDNIERLRKARGLNISGARGKSRFRFQREPLNYKITYYAPFSHLLDLKK
jgi:hypothetical protein